MGASLKIGTVAGIAIKLHWSFSIIIFWAIGQGLSLGGGRAVLFSLASILLLFFFVTLHELGHAISALKFGVQVKDIILLPIGGLAQMRNLPEKPWQEFVIALAGPLVNLAVAAAGSLIVLVIWGPSLVLNVADSSGILLRNVYQIFVGRGSGLSVLVWIVLVNAILALFNLLPAFPMDGGRILRAGLALLLTYPRATRIAARVGQGLAVLMAVLALRGNLGLMFVAVFVFLGASYEDHIVQTRWAMRHLRVADVLPKKNLIRLNPDQALTEVMDLSFRWAQRDFPVVVENTLLGLLLHQDLVQAVRTGQGGQAVVWVMRKNLPALMLEDSLLTAQRFMAEADSTSLPIFHEGKFHSLISLQDINDAYLNLSVSRRL